jgi:fibronectin-binding autotransporter adhesin
MARCIEFGTGNMSFLSCVGSSWRNALRRTLVVVAVIGGLANGSDGFRAQAEDYVWTNGAGTGLWADSGNWAPNSGVGGPVAGDNLTLNTNLTGLAGNNFLALLTPADGSAVICSTNAINLSGSDPKYIWTLSPATTGPVLTGSRYLHPTGGITMAADSGPVFFGNANSVVRRPLVIRLQGTQSFVNNSSNDLTFGTPINTPYNATTGVGGNGTVTGVGINGNNTDSPLSVLTMSANASGNIVNNGSMSNGTGGLQMVVDSIGSGRVILNGTSTFNSTKLAGAPGVVVQRGILQIGTGGDTGLLQTTSTGVQVDAGATLVLNRSPGMVYNWSGISAPITGEGNVEVAGGMTLFFNTPQAYTGTTTISSGKLLMGAAASTTGSVAGPIAIAAGSSLEANFPSNQTFQNAISGGGKLVKAGSGLLTLDGASTFTGGMEIVDGSVALGPSGSFSPLGIITVGAGKTFDLTAKDKATLEGFAGTGTVVLPTDTLAVSTLLPGSSPGTLTFVGSGTLDISGAAQGGLDFELGAASDWVDVSGGTLALGDGLIDFGNFTFTTGSGFAEGTYTLFSAGSITGSLGANVVGQVGGLDAALLVSGNSLQLRAVPEPSAFVLAVLGLGAAVLVWRRRAVRHPA